MEVYNVLGNGFLEAVYEEALGYEFKLRKIPYRCQPEIKILYKGKVLDRSYKPDFVVFDKIVVELKAMEKIGHCEYAQLINYLKATNFEVGIIINFGSESEIEWKRIILTIDQKKKQRRSRQVL